jgi:selenocysteine-specific elongation factor
MCGAAWDAPQPAMLAAQAGLADEAEARAILESLERDGALVRLDEGARSHLVHAALCLRAVEQVEPRLTAHLDANPRLAGVARGEWKGWMPRACPSELRPSLAEWMIRTGRVALSDGYVVPRGHRTALSAEDQKLMDAMLSEFAAAGCQPPALAELACRTPRNEKRLRELVALAQRRGRLISIAPDMRLHAGRYAEAIERLTAALRDRGGLTVSEIRTLLGSSRKFVVPMLEHLDEIGVTRRDGDIRRPGAKAAVL